MDTLSRRQLLSVALGCALVAFCYYFVDRPVARFMDAHRFYSIEFLAWPPRLSDWLTYVVMAGMVAVAGWWVWRPGGRSQVLLLVIAGNLVATTAVKSLLKWAFGRSWPQTWIDNNPSLIVNGVYGFHPFHYSKAYSSFPSGHAAATFAVVSILWLCRPRFRWLYILLAAAICLSLVALNFHFVGDVLAGAMLGSTTGICATSLFHRQLLGRAREDCGRR